MDYIVLSYYIIISSPWVYWQSVSFPWTLTKFCLNFAVFSGQALTSSRLIYIAVCLGHRTAHCAQLNCVSRLDNSFILGCLAKTFVCVGDFKSDKYLRDLSSAVKPDSFGPHSFRSICTGLLFSFCVSSTQQELEPQRTESKKSPSYGYFPG